MCPLLFPDALFSVQIVIAFEGQNLISNPVLAGAFPAAEQREGNGDRFSDCQTGR